jgi:hypothetical protein
MRSYSGLCRATNKKKQLKDAKKEIVKDSKVKLED